MNPWFVVALVVCSWIAISSLHFRLTIQSRRLDILFDMLNIVILQQDMLNGKIPDISPPPPRDHRISKVHITIVILIDIVLFYLLLYAISQI